MFQFLAIFACAGMVVGEKLYPDLSCHRGYNNDTVIEVGTADDLVRYYMNQCKDAKDCFKICVMSELVIIKGYYDTPQQIELSGESQIAEHVGVRLFKDYDYSVRSSPSSETIAKKIVSSCTTIAKKTKSVPCSKKQEFISCVEKAWAC